MRFVKGVGHPDSSVEGNLVRKPCSNAVKFLLLQFMASCVCPSTVLQFQLLPVSAPYAISVAVRGQPRAYAKCYQGSGSSHTVATVWIRNWQ